MPVGEPCHDRTGRDLLRCPVGHDTEWIVLDVAKQRVVGVSSSGVGGMSEDSIRRSRAQTSVALRREAARQYADAVLRDIGRRR